MESPPEECHREPGCAYRQQNSRQPSCSLGLNRRPALFLMVNLSARPLFFKRRLNSCPLEMPSALAKREAAKLGCFDVTPAHGSLWRGEAPGGKTVVCGRTLKQG